MAGFCQNGRGGRDGLNGRDGWDDRNEPDIRKSPGSDLELPSGIVIHDRMSSMRRDDDELSSVELLRSWGLWTRSTIEKGVTKNVLSIMEEE